MPDTSKWKIRVDEYFKSDERNVPEQYKQNAMELLRKVNIVRNAYGQPMIVTSGYRNPMYNAEIGGANNSAHTRGMAVDFRDRNGALSNWLLNNLQLLKDIGLFMENPMYTRGWVHLDMVERKNVVFLPYSSNLF